MLYDLLGLEWCDDSLSSLGLLSQSFGAFLGLPLAGKQPETRPKLNRTLFQSTCRHFSGLMLDIYQMDPSQMSYIFYLAGSCLMAAFLILTPGRDLKKHLSVSYKQINRYYIQKRT